MSQLTKRIRTRPIGFAATNLLLAVTFALRLHAQTVVDKANELIGQGRYSQAAALLESNRPHCDPAVYSESCWKYFFALGYAYRQAATLASSQEVEILSIPAVLKARDAFMAAVAMTELLPPTQRGATQVSDALFLAEIELGLQNYETAALTLDELEGRLAAAGLKLGAGKVTDIFKRFRLEISKAVTVGRLLLGNVGPFGFSYVQINPRIELRSVVDSRLSRLRVTYRDINGTQETYIERDGDSFSFQPLLLLRRRGVFPFDKYEATIDRIRPPSLAPGTVPLSIEGISYFDGTASFRPDAIDFAIKRHPAFVVGFYVVLITGVTVLLIVNKSIPNMRESSFQPDNLMKRADIIAAVIALLIAVFLDPRNALNLYSVGCALLVAVTVFRMIRRYHVLKRSRP